MDIKRWRPELVGLILTALLTRFWMLFRPNAVVFDEVYFKSFAAHYLDGRYYFDIHPPLGKLLLAGVAKITGLQPDAMLSGTVVVLRLLPAFAGVLLVPLMWGILRRLGASRPFAFLGSFLILFDNALLVESRFILMDSLLLLFGLSALYFYLVARDTTHKHPSTHWRWVWLSLAALMAGAAASIKWTGLTALALIGLIWLWDQRSLATSWGRRAGELAILGLIPLMLYVSVFWVHFRLLPASGEGDAFMTPKFQAGLQDSSYYDPTVRMSFGEKFIELNDEMFRANQTLTATHPYSSHWYAWPFQIRPIYYWQGPTLTDNRQGNIYLLGNPMIWWGLWAALVVAILYTGRLKRRLRPTTIAALAIAGAAYVMNFLPFMAVTRVMFLYHYLFAFCFSIIFVVMLWNDLANPKHDRLTGVPRRLYLSILALVALSFIFFAPLTFGAPLSPDELQARMWLTSWR